MRKLVRQVGQPSRVRLRHVVIAAGCVFAGFAGLAHAIRDGGYPRDRIAREQEQIILENFNRHPPRLCPTIDDDPRDPWGDDYQIVCHAELDRLIVTVVSQGEGDGEAIATSKTFWH